MAETNELRNGAVEWRVDVLDGTTKTLAPKQVLIEICEGVSRSFSKFCNFLKKAREIGEDDPRKLIHCLKVGVALTVVSLFYYMRPLYEGVGRNAMWAVMTVVVVFEYTVGSTISRSVNRVCGTVLAGLLGVGVNFVADQSGEQLKPFVIGVSVFVLASAATFSRFIPKIKARFDYCALIFILTFSLVSVSGYRVDELLTLACQRLSTVAIGTSLCIVVSMMVCPIWAGEELHRLIIRNTEKLSDSLEGITSEFFSGSKGNGESLKNLNGYKCVLNSKAAEETMANLARWEPAHDRFPFTFPWGQYLKIGASLRGCAYCLEALHSCLIRENQVNPQHFPLFPSTHNMESKFKFVNAEQVPQHVNRQFSVLCLELISKTLAVLGDVTVAVKSMSKTSVLDALLAETDGAVKDLEEYLSDVSNLMVHSSEESQTITDVMDVIPAMTFASLLIEISTRTKAIAGAVQELSESADFRPGINPEAPKQSTTQESLNLSVAPS
ncbi:hypothetical protein MLD38_027683 [Melastoma candidum]|uniref:Uncharacterized protein n=1 Tax=Melastoma candidum TaxID=119954 RepID=A0ACB9P3J6_9MYRT|nr:hypothetical protein MLD38_027683 [Melastoma candidum]